MTYEYRCEDAGHCDVHFCNRLGKFGWRLVGIYAGEFWFMRETKASQS